MDSEDRIKLRSFVRFLQEGWTAPFDEDYGGVFDDWVDWAAENLEQPALKKLCELFGHDPVQDHCGMPNHDFCLCCNKILPGEAHK